MKKDLKAPALDEIEGVRQFILFYEWAYPHLSFREKINQAIDYYKTSLDYSYRSENPGTIRERLLVNDYKSRARYEKKLTRDDFPQTAKEQQGLYSIDKHSKRYRKPSVKELKNVIAHLQAFPLALKAAINDLDVTE